MPKREQHDHSPGDARKPFSDVGGPEGRHAYTHNVRREALTNPKGPQQGEDFSADIAPDVPPLDRFEEDDEIVPAVEEKDLHEKLPMLTNDELAELPVLEPGAKLEQGATYVDLEDLQSGPFRALGGHVAEPGHRYVPKHEVAYDLWNRLVGQNEQTRIERPPREEHGVANQRELGE